MPFRYDQYHPALTDTIAARIANQGAIEAQRAQNVGNAYAGMVQNIGSAVAQIPGQIQQQKRAAVADESASLQLGEQKRAIAGRDAFAKIIKDTPQVDEDGVSLYDIPAVAKQLAAAGQDPAIAVEHLGKLNDAFRSEKAAKLALIKTGAAGVAAAGNDPVLAAHFLDQLEKNGSYPAAQVGQFRKLIEQGGQPAVERLTAYLMGPQKPMEVPAGGTLVDPVTHKPVFSAPEKPVSVPEGGSLVSPNTGEVVYKAQPKPQTAEQDNGRYIDIQARKAQKQPVTAMEQAWADAYEKQKTLATDRSASAAADRQSAAITQSTAQQKRAQDFQQLQAARADIQKNVDTPFLTARTSADTLRDVVSAAKAGNKVAGSLQSLETTMAAIRAQGLNRVNTAEIGATGDAGSLWDRISGYIGKRAEGQPVPADIQKDMIEFADILDKAAAKKYSDAHDAVNSLYGTKIPKTFQQHEPAPGQARAGLERVIGPNGETGTVPAGTSLPAGWRKQ